MRAVEPMSGQGFLGEVAEETGGEGIGEDDRLAVDEQMCRSHGGGREGGVADARRNTGKVVGVHPGTVPIRFRAYHKNESYPRRRSFRLGCVTLDTDDLFVRAAIVDASGCRERWA